MTPLRTASKAEQAAARHGYLSAAAADPRIVPLEYGYPDVLRLRWLQGYDAGIYRIRRGRTAHDVEARE